MNGAIFGDKAGSVYEFGQIKEIKGIHPKELILPNSFYSDDTIETIAIADAVINEKDYGQILKRYIKLYQNYQPNFSPYFKTAFSPETIKWSEGKRNSNSIGNGAMMRISPIGYLFNNEKDVIEQAKLATVVSHNSEQAINCAIIIALMIFYFKNGLDKEAVYKKLNLSVEYMPFTKFNTTCEETLGNCLYALYYSTSFEDAIRKTLIMGGDTDTNACIVGSVAEALYGMTKEQIIQSEKGLPESFIKILKKSYIKRR